MAEGYDFKSIEERWSREWTSRKAWSAPETPAERENKRYLVTMFPYPSGDLHMGHVEIFSIHDAIARFGRARGHDVLNPIGWDAFGLPAENAAIRRNINPKVWTYDNIAKHRSSMEKLGCSFDWERVFNTCDPSYYRWNQWLFLRFYERGLAHRKEAPAWWCPNCKTVLANEQVVAGRCDNCDTPVVKRNLAQWFFRITDYADRLLDDIEINVGWTERLKTLQRNWIGRSHGAEVRFAVEGVDEPVTVFTTRPDTLWGTTFFALAPEHPLAEELAAGTDVEQDFKAFKEEVERLTDIDRAAAEREKKGLFLGKHAVNPVNGERIPVWVADYVLMEYGTGAIMAVPAHDERDLDFARQNDLPVRVVIQPERQTLDPEGMEPYLGEGVMVNSGHFDGTSTEHAVSRVTEWLEEQGLGRFAIGYKLRDWLISRQRYWGTPIPIIYCENCGEVPVPEDELPVVLPEIEDFTPTGEASPLAKVGDWVNVACPKCGAAGKRETDTMDTFVDSSWYFVRYLDPRNDAAAFDPEKVNAWMPMDQYTGGVDHAVKHLIYARFFQKVFVDMGLAEHPEPFPRLLNQGQVTMGGKKMSKSRGNIVEPVEALAQYGADALRLYMLFSGPPEQDFDWPPEGVTAIGRVAFPWLRRVWRLCEENRDMMDVGEPHLDTPDLELRKQIHRTIKIVTDDYKAFRFNTAIARLMELVNEAYRYRAAGRGNPQVLRELIEALLKMLAPIAPYLAQEQWARLGHDGFIHEDGWPAYDDTLAAEEEITMVVQVNGKVRDTIPVSPGITEAEMIERALASEKVRGHLDGKEPFRIITKPPNLVSLVVPKG